MTHLRLRLTTFALSAFSMLSGCSPSSPDYRDTPDTASMRAAFDCAGERGARSEQACDALDEFDGASPVRHPQGQSEVYIGESLCAGVESHAFDVWTLAALPSSSSAPHARRPAGDLSRCVRSFHPRYRAATETTLAALREGAETPGVELGGVVPSTWSDWTAPCTPLPSASASDGRSLLVRGPGSTPSWWDDAPPRPPAEYLRQGGDVLYFVRPSGGSGPGVCVTKAYRVPSR